MTVRREIVQNALLVKRISLNNLRLIHFIIESMVR